MVMQGSSHRLLVLLGALLLTWVRTPAQGPPAVPTPAEEEPLSFTANAGVTPISRRYASTGSVCEVGRYTCREPRCVRSSGRESSAVST